jgi:hypothetical protein
MQKRGFMGLNLDPEVLLQLKSDLIDRVEDRITAVIVNALPEHALGDLNAALNSGGDDAFMAFLARHLPDYELLVAVALKQFQVDYLNGR